MKKLALLLFPLFSFFAFPSMVFAADGPQTLCSEEGMFAALCDPQIGDILVGLINLIFILAVIVALLYLIWGGFKWLTSGGDKTAVQTAREHLVAAIVGLVVIFLSYFILNFVIGFFIPGFQLNKFVIPSIENPTGKQTNLGGSGDACTRDSQCRSNNCDNGTCRRSNQ